MNWEHWQLLSILAAHRTLAAAAHTLRVSPATMARRVDELERAAGLRLVDRTREGYALTTHARALLDPLDRVSASLASVHRKLDELRAGDWPDPIRVSATEPVIAEVLAPALPALIRAAPELEVHLVSSSEVVSLSARKAEIAIRLAQPRGNRLLSQRLRTLEMGLFAASAHLANRPPDRLDLERERFLSYDDSYGEIAETAWFEHMRLQHRVFIRTSSTRALLAAVAAGCGIAILPRFLALRYPILQEISVPVPVAARPIWMVCDRDLAAVPAIRQVRTWIQGVFRGLKVGQPATPSPAAPPR